VKVQVPWTPKQGSGQPGKEEVADGAAVSVTELPESKVALHPEDDPLLQSIPAGELVIRPAPSPLVVTVRTGRVKVTVVLRSVPASVLQVGPVPLQAPLHPSRTDPVAGAAVKVTLLPEVKLALQVPGQEMPAGEEVMVPAPFPAVATEMVCPPGLAAVKDAVTVVVPLMVTMQVPVPVQAPDQPVKLDPMVAEAVRVTTVPSAKIGLQVDGQETPAGEEVTVPDPVPAITTLSEPGAGRKVAVTELSAESVTLQSPVPVQAPDQPPKVDAPPARAVSVTTAPSAKPALQVPGQEMPAGDEVMVPVPPPAAVTVRLRPPCVKVAVTLAVEFIVRTQLPVPAQGPDQPVKLDPTLAEAVKVTVVPAA
jgi:hypothetical protein